MKEGKVKQAIDGLEGEVRRFLNAGYLDRDAGARLALERALGHLWQARRDHELDLPWRMHRAGDRGYMVGHEYEVLGASGARLAIALTKAQATLIVRAGPICDAADDLLAFFRNETGRTENTGGECQKAAVDLDGELVGAGWIDG